tara:strand:- start:312 stop:461 length:150 start_codon:yes stop_codon:yes gene_type:complete
MIKKIKYFICKIFNIKACQCEVDEHIEMYEEVRTDKTKKILKKYKRDSE